MNNKALRIILKYSTLIFLVKFFVGLVVNLIFVNEIAAVSLILLIPMLVVYYLLTWRGTEDLGKVIRAKNKIQFGGLIIIGLPLTVDYIIGSLLSNSFGGLTSYILIFCITSLAVFRVSKKF
jgi:hypothetical protein